MGRLRGSGFRASWVRHHEISQLSRWAVFFGKELSCEPFAFSESSPFRVNELREEGALYASRSDSSKNNLIVFQTRAAEQAVVYGECLNSGSIRIRSYEVGAVRAS